MFDLELLLLDELGDRLLLLLNLLSDPLVPEDCIKIEAGLLLPVGVPLPSWGTLALIHINVWAALEWGRDGKVGNKRRRNKE